MDRLWLAVARDSVARIAVFCPATGDAFCPYGGGADVFVWGSKRRFKLGDRFSARRPSAGTPDSLPQASAGGMVAERR